MVTSATVASMRIGVPSASGTTRLTRSVASACADEATIAARTSARPLTAADYNLVTGMTVWRGVAFLACMAIVSPAGAQILPSEPIAFADGRVTIGGDVSATFGSHDPGFFDYTDY